MAFLVPAIVIVIVFGWLAWEALHPLDESELTPFDWSDDERTYVDLSW